MTESRKPKPVRETEAAQDRAAMMLRLPTNTMDMLKMLAKQRGRSVTREVQHALDLHVTASVLDSLDDAEFVSEVIAMPPNFDIEDLRAELEQDVLMLRALAFARPMPVDKLAALLRP